MKRINILTPGGYTTVQDLGRRGFAKYGVPLSGSLDTFSARMANMLVGNPESAALLELTVIGPSIEIQAEMDIALTGAKMSMTLNKIPVPRWTAFRAVPGDVLRIGQVSAGCRGYLAFGGGIDIPSVMGSFSTYVGGKLGGFKGRPLAAGDIVDINVCPLLERTMAIPKKYVPEYPSQIEARVVIGPQQDYFDMDDSPLFDAPYMVTAKADRMGYRLQGSPIAIKENMPQSIISEAAQPGSIQIPPDQQPIILWVEQTVGGYAKIATVISTDLPCVAQATPGDLIAFTPVNIEQAHRIYKDQTQMVSRIKAALRP